MMINFSVETIATHPEAKIIHLKGEIDENNLPELEGFLGPLVADEINKIFIFRMAELEFMNSKVIGYLSNLHNQLTSAGRKLIFAEYNETINDIITLVGMDQIVEHFPTTQEAIHSLN